MAYSRHDYHGAKALLASILPCQDAPRNDMAVTLHHLGDDEGCVAILMPLLELAKTPESRMPRVPRQYWDQQRKLARQTRRTCDFATIRGPCPADCVHCSWAVQQCGEFSTTSRGFASALSTTPCRPAERIGDTLNVSFATPGRDSEGQLWVVLGRYDVQSSHPEADAWTEA
jgi:hypothetical protein